jgi:hypothetical protein
MELNKIRKICFSETFDLLKEHIDEQVDKMVNDMINESDDSKLVVHKSKIAALKELVSKIEGRAKADIEINE